MFVEVLPCLGCFITCMSAHFPAVELDYAIQFSTFSMMSGYLWHSSKWACRFWCYLQYTLGLEVLGCSLNTDLNYVTIGKVRQLFGCILIEKYLALGVLSPGPEALC